MDTIPMPPQERSAVASACQIGDAYLYQVLTRRKVPSAELCVSIERATSGRVNRQLLRPGDWQRIWPELIEAVDDEEAKQVYLVGTVAASQQGVAHG